MPPHLPVLVTVWSVPLLSLLRLSPSALMDQAVKTDRWLQPPTEPTLARTSQPGTTSGLDLGMASELGLSALGSGGRLSGAPVYNWLPPSPDPCAGSESLPAMGRFEHAEVLAETVALLCC